MQKNRWNDMILPPAPDDDYAWELFHENSKTEKHRQFMTDEAIAARMAYMSESLNYEGFPIIDLPEALKNFDKTLAETIISRVTPAKLEPQPVTLEQVSTLLYAGYGVTRTNKNTSFLRPFRTVPSGGGLYPLEIYFTSKHIAETPSGLFHYNPMKHHLRLLQEGDLSPRIAEALVPFQSHLAFDVSLMVIITGHFGRSTFKYGARGYRFVFLEAGHMAQNINLAATALNLGCLNVGGFFDHDMDDFLNIDGLNQSTIYMIAIGKKAAIHQEPSPFYGEKTSSNGKA